MKIEGSKVARKIICLVIAILLYYIIHEGAHLIYALATGTFQKIAFLFPGMQIKIDASKLSEAQLGIFSLLGAIATLSVAYILSISSRKIALIKNNYLRAIFFYTTVLFLLNDPIYLSLLCGFFGGGDMNGIELFIPEIWVRISFFIIGAINIILIFKYLVPTYRVAFNTHNRVSTTIDMGNK